MSFRTWLALKNGVCAFDHLLASIVTIVESFMQGLFLNFLHIDGKRF